MGSELEANGGSPGGILILATDSVQGMDAFVTLHGLPLGVQSDIDLKWYSTSRRQLAAYPRSMQ